MTDEEWTKTVAINLTGAFFTSREFVQRLLAADRPGRIVNVSSTAAFRGSTTGHAPYDASKGGLVSFTLRWPGKLPGMALRSMPSRPA